MLFPGYAPIYTPIGLNQPLGWVAPVAPIGWGGYGPGWAGNGYGWGGYGPRWGGYGGWEGHGHGHRWGRGDGRWR